MNDLIVAPPKDIEQIIDIDSLNKFVEQAKEIADAIEITDDSEASLATDSLSSIKKMSKEVEEKRKAYVGPFNAVVDKINSTIKPFTASLASAETTIKQKVADYTREKENRRRAEESKRQAEFAAKIAAEQEKAKEEKRETKIIAPPVAIMEQNQIRGGAGVASTSKFWNYEVVDLSLLARTRPDLVKIEIRHRETLEACKTKQEIQGLRVFEDIRVSAR